MTISHTVDGSKSYNDLVKSLSPNDILSLFKDDIIPLSNDLSLSPSSPPTSSSSSSSSSSPSKLDSLLFQGHDQEQIKLMNENCIVADYHDTPLGGATKKVCHIKSNIDRGLLHRAFSVFLFNSSDNQFKLLLQQRADEKITFANMWTNTCCSHPLLTPSEFGSTLEKSILGAKNAAQRKLFHELGIDPSFVPIEKFKFLTRIHYMAPNPNDTNWAEHEIDYILFIKSNNPPLNPNWNEIKDYRYVSITELKQMFQDESIIFTPWFKLICEAYLFKWWEKLINNQNLPISISF
ncbi:isopentenyl-diphosphate delta-isomerase IDI1 [Ascoidea rubescens DSM 1968]|uniref:Isopentenyl-diphosphate Delta-isomerase n=1 Tax=Ascoidea rubescens DSM 1968 TaxID=1344418 RepID=A0A1D2VIG5_9ASCO|nr:Isopentenyldiphosphate isomerase [Ascoidea rubescens DSM 1968]ODV61267.1 Isopentenyldiphosphate isomerase [Ascoidea rubescens DSM 1968]